jgi:glycosyltransferase involved in cell wall biosynthesis
MTINDSDVASREPSAESSSNNGSPGSNSTFPICLVGPGWKFTSGISYYTCRLANAIDDQHGTSVILLRRLLPKRFYPGKQRVGLQRARMSFRPNIRVHDGIDWWWGRSLAKALKFLRGQRPKVLVLEWWTAATLHTYLVLAIAAHAFGIRVVIEIHELQDPGEASVTIVRHYARWGLRTLLRLSHGCVVHSKSDWTILESGYGSMNTRVAIAAHGPYDQYGGSIGDASSTNNAAVAAVKAAPRPHVVNLLFFGLIRPYKGLEDLLCVFNGLSKEEADGLWLTVVGETWEGCTEPAHLIRVSPHSDRITFVNEYVSDEVVGSAFAHADVVVLPYRRSSSSGILHVAMSWGLPIVVTSVGGLPEAASGYDGAIFVPPNDLAMLKSGIMRAAQMVGQRFVDPRDWGETVHAIRLASGVAPDQEIPLSKQLVDYLSRPRDLEDPVMLWARDGWQHAGRLVVTGWSGVEAGLSGKGGDGLNPSPHERYELQPLDERALSN